MSGPRYHINLFWSAEDACWVADVPDPWPCAAYGPAPRGAFDNVHDAVDGWLEVACDRAMPIPEALSPPRSTRPETAAR